MTLSAAAGLVLDDWQQHVLVNSLAERLDYKWAAPEVGIVVPRQQGKGSIIEARELAGLFLFGEQMILHTAHELKTAQQAFSRIEGLIRGTPELNAQVQQIYTGNTQNAIVLNPLPGEKKNRELRFIARTPGAGRGFSADLLILDEAYALTDRQYAALKPTLTTSPNPQTIYASSAGLPDSEFLARLRERGMTKSTKGLAYFEWSAPDDADPDDIEALVAANPGLGIRMSMDHVASERGSMDEETFKRERLGIWAKLGGDTAITTTQWNAVADPASTPGPVAAFAIDVPYSRASASIAAVSARPDGRLHAEVIERRTGTSWAPTYLARLQEAWGLNGTEVYLDGAGAAGALIPDLERERVRFSVLTRTDIGRACAQIYDDVTETRLVHRNQPELSEAVEGATTTGSGTSASGQSLWRWRPNGTTDDISALYAITLARWGWSLRGEKKQRAQQRRASGQAPTSRKAGRRRSRGRSAARR